MEKEEPRTYEKVSQSLQRKETEEMKITIETVPHLTQRYNTCGDWQFNSRGDLHIRVSSMSEPHKEMAVIIHELTEALLCLHHGISQKEVDDFDLSYNGDGEPGDDPEAPYSQEHCIASGIERIFAAETGIIWKDYEEELEKMTKNYERNIK